jgi:membrane protease YdiL (CAAX protease family)
MHSSNSRSPRWPLGGWKRVAHALSLGFLQPVVPIALFGGLSALLFDAEGELLPPRALTFLAVGAVGAIVPAVLVGGGLLGLGRLSLADLGLRRERLARELLLGLVGLGVYLACYYAIVRALRPDAAEVLHSVASQTPGERALLLLVGLAIAAFEEPAFRGYLQPALVQRLGLVGGVAVTALVFAAWHPPFFNVTSFLVRLSLGLVTGISRGRDRPLTAALAAHALLWPVVGLS